MNSKLFENVNKLISDITDKITKLIFDMENKNKNLQNEFNTKYLAPEVDINDKITKLNTDMENKIIEREYNYGIKFKYSNCLI